MFAKTHLAWANDLQEQFRRNGKVVDREVNHAIAEVFKTRRGMPLKQDQLEAYKSCEELENEDGDESGGWKPIPSPFVDISMKLKHSKPKKGERSVALGQAEAIIGERAR